MQDMQQYTNSIHTDYSEAIPTYKPWERRVYDGLNMVGSWEVVLLGGVALLEYVWLWWRKCVTVWLAFWVS